MLLTKKTDETKFHSGCDLQAVESTTELYFTRNIQKRIDNCDGRTRLFFKVSSVYNKIHRVIMNIQIIGGLRDDGLNIPFLSLRLLDSTSDVVSKFC